MATVLLPPSLLNPDVIHSPPTQTSVGEDSDPFLDLLLDLEPGNKINAKIVRTSELKYEKLPRSILLREDTSSGCGGKTWQAADVICNYLIWKYHESHGKAYQDKNIVELGSGTGVVGLALGVLCAPNGVKEIVITDQLSMLALMRDNIHINALGAIMKAEVLDWGLTLPTWITSKPDIIIASDCVYLELAFKPLIDTLVMLSKENTEIYLCYERRRRADKHFFRLAKKKFIINEILDDPHRPDYERKGIHLYLLKLKK